MIMKNSMKKKLCFLLLVLASLTDAVAYDFGVKAEGPVYYEGDYVGNQDLMLYYTVNEEKSTVSVSAGPDVYKSLAVEIPHTVVYKGVSYNVTKIGEWAFSRSEVGYVVLPNSIVEICNYAFSLSSVEHVHFPLSLNRICEGAFSGSNLKEAILPEGLVEIGSGAFGPMNDRDCAINKVTLPTSLLSVGESAFFSSSLRDVEIPLDCGIKEIPNRAFSGCPIQSITLPNNLERIGDYAFSGTNISSISFPSKLREIGDWAFAYTKFKKMVLPNTITSLGECAFHACPNLEEFTFPSSITKIPNGMFGTGWGGCENLVKVTIPQNITQIGSYAFRGCTSLFYIDIPESVIKIGEEAFKESGIKKIDFPSRLNIISNGLFEGCKLLTEITIPDAIETIGDQAFYNCSSLQIVNMSRNIERIGDFAFALCPIERIVLPSSLESVGEFLGLCSTVKEVHVNRSIPPVVHWYSNAYEQWIDSKVGDKDLLKGATLFVPIGCTAAYKNSDGWNVFGNIKEENVDGRVFYQIATSVQPTNSATLTVNGKYYNGEKCKIEINKDALITVIPNEDFRLHKLLVNGQDVTKDVHNNTYTIKNITEKQYVEAFFSKVYYLYNNASRQFFCAANSWGTQASLGDVGLDVGVIKLNDGSYAINTCIDNGNDNRYLSVIDDNAIFCDQPLSLWTISKRADGSYTIATGDARFLSYDGRTTVLTLTTNANDVKAGWQLLTKSDMLSRLEKANANNPVDATFLLPGAGFGRNDIRKLQWQGEPVFGGIDENQCAEKFNTTFDVYQTLIDLPNGSYKITMQGFYREGADENYQIWPVIELRKKGEEHLYAQLYANEQSTQLRSIFDEAGKLGEDGVSSDWGFVPNSLTEASRYFSANLYNNEVKTVVSDGKLRIGVRKSTPVEKDWTIFDNFRIIYLGKSIYGDVNGDNVVDVADIASVISVMASGSGIANPLQQSADVNKDGVVDVADIATIISEMAAQARALKIDD